MQQSCSSRAQFKQNVADPMRCFFTYRETLMNYRGHIMKEIGHWLFLFFGCLILYFIGGLVPTLWVGSLIILCFVVVPWIIEPIIKLVMYEQKGGITFERFFGPSWSTIMTILEIGKYILALPACVVLFLFFKWIPTIAFVILSYIFMAIRGSIDVQSTVDDSDAAIYRKNDRTTGNWWRTKK